MAKFINFLLALAWFVYLLCAGIHLFSKGFLLSRVSQMEVNECTSFDQLLCAGDTNEVSCKASHMLKDVNSTAKACLPKKSKVVLVIVDALRYDFGAFNPDLKNPEPFQNRLTIMHKLLTTQPNKTRLMNFIADPPTTTLQRLKGMTTGSLPTFIDIGSNFASPEINEDNIIDQMHRHNRTTVFMGDSTWLELFPNRFKRQYGYPSFNIQDLDTVDTAIERQFPKELAERDWDVIVAHFLGVDHCGHKHGPYHPEMARKLDEMNEFITNVTTTMDDDTILMVMGDHGMSNTGDHGGDTHNEITSLLFMYSKGHVFNAAEYSFDEDSLQQIDLVPTLAAILGIPSPYSNLGIINLHLLPVAAVDQLSPYQVQLLHLWHNSQQIQHYFQKYAQQHRGTFESHSLESLEHTYVSLSHRVNTIYSKAAFLNFAKDVRAHLKQVLTVCRGVWVKFDAQLMSQGMLITFIATFLVYVLINHVGVQQLPHIFGDKVLGVVYLSNSALAIPSILFYKEFGMSNETHSILFFTSILSFGILGYLIVQNWPSIAMAMSQISRYGNVIARFAFTFSCGCFFSNSYLVEEQRILGYLLISLFIYFLYQLATTTTITRELKARFRWSVFVKSVLFKLVVVTTVALLMLRMAFHYFKCREEQGDCQDVQMKEALRPRRRSTRSFDLVPVIVLGLFATLSRIYLRSCGNLTGYGVHTMLARFGPTLAAVCAGGHFVLTKNLAHDIKLVYIDALAWVIYALFAAQLLMLAASPLLVYVLPKRSGQVSINEYANIIPELYRKLKQNFGQSGDQNSDVPIVCGLATVYSSVFISLATIFGLLLCLLLGPQPSTGFVIVVAISVAVIVLNSIIRYETASTLERSLQPQFVTLVTWLLLAQFGFYATSHQPTMSQIDWSSAFIGRTMHFDHSMLLSAILVILNTFCASFFFGLLYPLLVVAPFCLYSIWPTLSVKVFKRQNTTDSDVRRTADNVEYRRMTVNKPSGDGDAVNGGAKTATLLHIDFDVTRGEVNLFENETVFLTSAFKTGCQLLILQGIRVSCSMLASTILCRHLMVWKIFAPRFIYEGIASYAIFVSIIFGYAILIRIHSAVCELVDKLNKTQ